LFFNFLFSLRSAKPLARSFIARRFAGGHAAPAAIEGELTSAEMTAKKLADLGGTSGSAVCPAFCSIRVCVLS
jgi:hypothetical protein